MATIKRFEEIEAWQIGRELTREIYAISRAGDFSKDWGLKDQIQRAAVSICSNIAEEQFAELTEKTTAIRGKIYRFIEALKAHPSYGQRNV